MIPTEVDIVVAGGGPAGCATAGRLARADPYFKFSSSRRALRTMRNMQRIPENTKATFHEDTMASSHLRGRKSIVPPHVYEGGLQRLGRLDMPGWRGREDLLPLMKRVRSRELSGAFNNDTHGHQGPIAIPNGGQITPLAQDYLRAAREAGSPAPTTFQDCDTADGAEMWKKTLNSIPPATYIHPLRKLQKNLHLLCNSIVSCVIFEGDKAVGVAYVNPLERGHDTPKEQVVRARKLVVLACGTLGTPQILERSGVGNAQLLEKLDIAIVSDLPSVGEKYQDHYTMLQIFRVSPESMTTDDFPRDDQYTQDKVYNEWRTNPDKLTVYGTSQLKIADLSICPENPVPRKLLSLKNIGPRVPKTARI
ncbi:hypothetical protein JCM11641_002995 [Rhodosporidiobolus odoratus]